MMSEGIGGRVNVSGNSIPSLAYWAAPVRSQKGEINTRPYGSGG